MYQYVLRRIEALFEAQAAVFSDQDEKDLLAKVKKDREQFKHINFYHLHAKSQISNAVDLLQDYSSKLHLINKKLKKTHSPSEETTAAIAELDNILLDLDKRKNKLVNIKAKIPDGMLDVKRALWLTGSFSTVKEEDEHLHERLELLKTHLTGLNHDYVALVKKGDALENLLWKTTCFYWEQLAAYRVLLEDHTQHFFQSEHLTDSGQLAARCLMNALENMPSRKDINKVLSTLNNKKAVDKKKLLEQLGFCDSWAVDCATGLDNLGKSFFYLPHSNAKYHFDYNPTDDLLGTGGDCFGQSIMLIASLAQGKFKWLCPESGLINYQVDQSRPLPSPLTRETIATAETEVSAESEHDSIQWDDLKHVFSDERMQEGDLCGLHFSMNSYTMSQRAFTAGHIAVVAKLDPARSVYKYIVFEKEFGVFGLVDDASLERVINQITNIYKGMNYSKVKLVKYGEATDNTYNLVSTIKPVNSLIQNASIMSNSYLAGIFKVAPVTVEPVVVSAMPGL